MRPDRVIPKMKHSGVALEPGCIKKKKILSLKLVLIRDSSVLLRSVAEVSVSTLTSCHNSKRIHYPPIAY